MGWASNSYGQRSVSRGLAVIIPAVTMTELVLLRLHVALGVPRWLARLTRSGNGRRVPTQGTQDLYISTGKSLCPCSQRPAFATFPLPSSIVVRRRSFHHPYELSLYNFGTCNVLLTIVQACAANNPTTGCTSKIPAPTVPNGTSP